MSEPKFSIVAICKNEANTLPRLLGSLQEFKDRGGEICILDTGSTDKTVEVAKSFGCVVSECGAMFCHTIDKKMAKSINQKYIVSGEPEVVKEGDVYFDFASARNKAASLAKNKWICYADADECFSCLNIDRLNSIIKNEPNVSHFAYQFIFAHDGAGRPLIQFVQSKFYNREKLNWKNLVHECLFPI